MRPVRYALLVLLTLAPVLTFAQPPDSIHIEIDGVEYPAYGAFFGPQFPADANVGPYGTAVTEPRTACRGLADDDVEGLILNPEEVEGSVALIRRGGGVWNHCPFVVKVQAAQEAGAVAVVVYNYETSDPDYIQGMGGACPDCTIPAVFVSYNSGQAILASDPAVATFIPIRITPPTTSGSLDTGVVQTGLYDNGYLGRSFNPVGSGYTGPGFIFGGRNGLSVSAVLVGHESNVLTNPYNAFYFVRGYSEYVTVEQVAAISPPFGDPFESFDQGLTTKFASEEIGLSVTERAYARKGDAFVIIDLMLENETGNLIEDVYVGIFADFYSLGGAYTSLGALDEATNLLYIYDASGEGSYFGLAALSKGISGWTLTADVDTDASLFEGLTMPGTPLTEPQDAHSVLGVGPFDLGPGGTATARFAMLAGESEAAITASAAEARSLFTVAAEGGAEGPAGPALAVYPNPAAGAATVALTLSEAADVRVAVVDVLGREVAVVHEGRLAAGGHTLWFEGRSLPSGLYVVRAAGAGVDVVQRLTVVR